MVDLFRKLMLTGFLALVSPGSLLQIFIALVVALCLTALEMYVRPFNTLVRTFLSVVTGLALVLTLLGTLGFQIAQGPNSGFLTTTLTLAILVIAAFVVLLAALVVLLSSLDDARRVVVARLSAPPHLTVAPRPLGPREYHCLISHQWGSAQDQANALKSRLQALAPSLRCFLDVEDLEDTSELESYVKNSDVLVAFLSGSIDTQLPGDTNSSTSLADCSRSDYFRSAACIRELRAAEAVGKPICFVLERDPRHGAVPLNIHRRDCPEDLRHLLTAHPMVPWFRIGAFQQVSLRQVLQRVLGLDAGEIFVPGEVLREKAPVAPPAGPATFHLYTPAALSRGADEVVALLAAEAGRIGGCQLVTTKVPGERGFAAKMLLYLNAETAEAWPRLQAEVEAALREGGPGTLLLVHEQREGKGAISFDAIIKRTPARLMELGVYRLTALPLHESSPGVTLLSTGTGARPAANSTNEHLAVSLRLVLQAVSAAADAPTVVQRPRDRSSSARTMAMMHEVRRRAQTAATSISRRLRSRRTTIGDESGPRRIENHELMPVSGHGQSCEDHLPFSPSVRSSQQFVLRTSGEPSDAETNIEGWPSGRSTGH
jgi:hypothetical protein